MSTKTDYDNATIERLKVSLRNEGYCEGIQQHYPPVARRFLTYLESQNLSIETAQLSDVESFLLRELKVYRNRYGRAPRNVSAWRTAHVAPSRILLRLALGQEPREVPSQGPQEEFQRTLLCGYDTWMLELRGLAAITRRHRVADAKKILKAFGNPCDSPALRSLQIRDVDAYVRSRSASLGRSSIKTIMGTLRVFLRYLYGIGATSRDLSSSVSSPKIYTYEGIPSALRPEDVATALAAARQNLTAAGIRDYAILQLLATYGLRAGEVTTLRLDDIDWKKDILRIRHSKTGAHSILPLLQEPGEALLAYLERARPRTALREVFLCLNAPYRGFKEGSCLYGVARKALTSAGVSVSGKKGPHAFRHARAVSLLRAAVPVKTIGDILGHRSAVSTGMYLKLATEDLRAVALDIPATVSP
jgi:site-specific recombinase XerD